MDLANWATMADKAAVSINKGISCQRICNFQVDCSGCHACEEHSIPLLFTTFLLHVLRSEVVHCIIREGWSRLNPVPEDLPFSIPALLPSTFGSIHIFLYDRTQSSHQCSRIPRIWFCCVSFHTPDVLQNHDSGKWSGLSHVLSWVGGRAGYLTAV